MTEEKGLAGTESGKIPPEQWKKIDEIIEKYKHKEGTLIPVLKETQEVTGYLRTVFVIGLLHGSTRKCPGSSCRFH